MVRRYVALSTRTVMKSRVSYRMLRFLLVAILLLTTVLVTMESFLPQPGTYDSIWSKGPYWDDSLKPIYLGSGGGGGARKTHYAAPRG